MIRKVSRNDLCPCGSGIKFRQCCIYKYPGQKIFYEKKVLSKILETSSKFKNYFEEERPKINNTLIWALKKNGTPHIPCRNATNLQGEHIIWLKQIPPEEIKPSIIAHEIEHIVLVEEGFPIALPLNPLINISSFLNSLLQDPLIYERLEKFGFHVREDYIENVNEFLNELKAYTTPEEERSESLEKVKWILTYVQTNLIREIFLNEKDVEGFNAFFDEHYKELTREGKDLIEKIHEIGFHAVDEQNTLAQYIIDKYDLDKLLFVKNF